MRINCFKIFVFTFIILSPVSAQQFNKLNRPHITNYTKQIYNAENQNWSIDQDTAGNLYIGNNEGLLKFNGQSWELFKLPNSGIVRSVAVSHKGKIFIGSFEEFGFWEFDSFGEAHYYSLKNLLDDYSFHNEEIWKIIISGDEIYFQAFSKIFVYNGQSVKIINPSGIISSFSKVGDQLLIHILDKGIFELEGNTLRLIDNSDLFTNHIIRTVLPYKKNEYLIVSYENGIQQYNTSNKSVKNWCGEYSNLFKEYKINRAIRLQDGNYVIGTILDGIYIFDSTGTFIRHINQTNGLQNNTILSLFNDIDNHLWIGLDVGIDFIYLNSDISFFKEFGTNIGSVYSTIIFNNMLYAGTNRGLFASRLEVNPHTGILDLNFRLIENSQDQVWYLGIFDGQLFCGHNKGTFLVDKWNIVPISNITGGLCMTKFYKGNDEYLIQGTYTDLVIYKRVNNRWKFSHTVSNFQHPVKSIEVDHLNNIWVGHLLKGLYKLRLSDDLHSVIDEVSFGKQDNSWKENAIQVTKFRNRVIFINEGNTYTYNDFTDSIVSLDLLHSKLTNVHEKIFKIVPFSDNHCWIVSEQYLLYYQVTDSSATLLGVYPFESFNGELIERNEHILLIDVNRSIVGMNESVALICRKQEGPDLPFIKNVMIYKVVSSGHKQINLETKQTKGNIPVLPYNQNTISFDYSSPNYNSKIKFRVRLIGLDTSYTETDNNTIRYERLPYNSYTFQVSAIDEYGNISDIRTWSFIIKPPFYLSILAYIVYLSIFFGLFIFIRKYYRKRLKIQEQNLRDEKEKALIKMRNERLSSEIQQKTEQLADTTFAIIKKNELLMQIKRLLMSNRKVQDNSDKQINNTLRLIERNISNSDDWKIFENNFEQAHQEFLSRLKEAYPDLLHNDLKLCAFLRMNLSSKKIGSLLGISTRSVENHRYRIRKKLRIDHDANLTDFIMRF